MRPVQHRYDFSAMLASARAALVEGVAGAPEDKDADGYLVRFTPNPLDPAVVQLLRATYLLLLDTQSEAHLVSTRSSIT